MTTRYFLFPDARDGVGEGEPLTGEVPGDGVDLITQMVDHHKLAYPCLVVFQEEGQHRWSFANIISKGEIDSDEDG